MNLKRSILYSILFSGSIFSSIIGVAFSEAPLVSPEQNIELSSNEQWVNSSDDSEALERPLVSNSNNITRGYSGGHQSNSTNTLNNQTLDNYNKTDHKAINNTIPSSTQTDNSDLLEQLHGLQQEIQELRGQLEIAHHDIQSLKDQQLAFYKDLDSRIKPLATNTTSTATNTAITPVAAPVTATATPPAVTTTDFARKNSTEEQLSYMAAFDLIQQKQYNQALSAMEQFITHYPQGGYTANALYWLGELYMVQKDYNKALQHFTLVTQKYPNSNKSSASALKIGYAMAAMGQMDAARKQLNTVIKQYPDTATAQQAKKKLAQLA